MLTRYRTVLSVPGCARVLGTALIARLPQGMTSLGILLLIRSHTGSYAAAGIAVGAYDFSTAAGAPLVGRLIDRFVRRRVLGPGAMLQACVLVALVLTAHAGGGVVVLVVLSALAGGLWPPIAPSVRALLRDLLSDAKVRETAYALESVIQELVWITGPLVVAGVIAFASPATALLLSAAVSICGTFLFVSSPAALGRGSGDASGERARALAIPELRAMLGPIFLTGLAIGAIAVGLPALALHAGSRPASGLLLALWSVGSIVGGLWYGARDWRAPLTARYRALLWTGVICMAPLMAARTVPEGLVGAVLAGLVIAPVFSCQYALVGRSARAGAQTEAFTWVSSALVGGLAAGSALGGAAVSTAGVNAPFVLAVIVIGLAATSALRLPAGAEQPVG